MIKKIHVLLITILLLNNLVSNNVLTSIVHGNELNTINLSSASFENKVIYSSDSYLGIVEETVFSNTSTNLTIINVDKPSSIDRFIILADSDRYVAKYIINNSYRLLIKVDTGTGKSLYYVLLELDQLARLSRSRYVHSVLRDNIFYRNLLDFVKMKDLFKNRLCSRVSASTYEYYDYLPSLDLLKVPIVWRDYSVMGENVTVGIVDSGIDFANPDLGLETIARDSEGYPLILSINNGLVLFTNVSMKINNELITENTVVKVLDPIDLSVYEVKIGYNVTIGDINSLTGVYKVGLLLYYFIPLHLVSYDKVLWVKTFILAIMVDDEIPGVYSKVYFDLSTAFYDLSITMRELEKRILGRSVWREPLAEWADYSILDENYFKPGSEIIARDFDNDGYYDFSIGTVAGYYLDTVGLINQTPGYYVGWDYAGRFLSIMNDYFGHGTRVATIIAGRGSREYSGYNGLFRVKGVAPLSKIATGSVLWSYDTFILEAWLSGYTPIFRKIGDIYYIEFNYYGSKRADIINNSWSYINTYRIVQNVPGSDLLTYLFDTIVFTKTFIAKDPVILVFSTGNSGPGYSTIHSPSSGLLVLTIGASTWLKPLVDLGYNGLQDEVAPFSSRGPNALGYSKPDLVVNGLIEYTSTRVIDGYGYGSALDVFSGTSLAAPYVSGSLALLLNLYRNINGSGSYIDPLFARVLLKNSCDDLGYSPYVQGCGRLNVLRAAEIIVLNKPLVYVDKGLKQVFVENYFNIYGDSIYNALSYLYDTSHYDIVYPGYLDNFTLIVNNHVGEISIYSRELYLYKGDVVYDGVFNFRERLVVEIPKQLYIFSDYVEIIVLLENATYPPFMFSKTPISDSYSYIAYLFDWRDSDGDNTVDDSEKYYISLSYRTSVETYLTVSKPDEKTVGKLILEIEPKANTLVKPVDLKIITRAYKYRESSLLTYPSKAVLNGTGNISIGISIGNRIVPGIYETALVVEYGVGKVLIPVSILVPLVLDNLSTIMIGLEYSDLRYYTFRLRGLHDLHSSYETSDWRILPIVITEPNITGVLFVARWSSGYSTDLSIAITPPGGVFTSEGSINVFATYKLASKVGYVYNSNLEDQMNNTLRLYLPIEWSIVSRDIDIYGLSIINSDNPTSSPVLIYPGVFANRGFGKRGIYRLYFGFNSFSGKLLEDQVSFRIIIARSSLEVINTNSIGGINTYRLKYIFKAGMYTPFYLSKLYVVSNNTITIPNYVKKTIPLVIYNNVVLLVASSGYDMGVVLASKYLEDYVDILAYDYGVLEINTFLWIIDYPVRCEGVYVYLEQYGELYIQDITYPGIVSAHVFIYNSMD